MPRISADTVAEHVQQQEAAVIRAAAELFATRGVNDVSLGDIAAEVGLARNSLYRYFPDKAHIFGAWFRSELEPLQRASDQIAADGAPAGERLERWLHLHLEYLVAPEHQAMMAAAADGSFLTDDARADIGAGHQELYGTLSCIVSDLLGGTDPSGERDARTITMLITGLLRSAADLVIGGSDRREVAGELTRVALAACA